MSLLENIASYRRRYVVLAGVLAGLGALTLPALASLPTSLKMQRTFSVTQRLSVKELPPGKTLRMWVPVPQSNGVQRVSTIKIDAPLGHREIHDSHYGNRVLVFEGPRPSGGELAITLSFDTARDERSGSQSHEEFRATDKAALARFLAPDELVPLNDKIRALAKEVTAGKQGTMEKARAIYDHVISTMKYDKSGTGWGRGDAVYACDVRQGNCTDFHSLFIALARASGVPARFEIGYPIPVAAAGDIAGYHCWASFYVEGKGWIPVDSSEAWKHPEKKEYFFGKLDPDRFLVSIGRDVVLIPAPTGGSVNFLLKPMAEVDGAAGIVDSKLTYGAAETRS